jgi:hypothetical protein
MADRNIPGVWKSGKQRSLPTFPHPRLRRRADIDLSRCATLTTSLVQKIGQTSVTAEQNEIDSVSLLMRSADRDATSRLNFTRLRRSHDTIHRILFVRKFNT